MDPWEREEGRSRGGGEEGEIRGRSERRVYIYDNILNFKSS